MLKLVFTVTLAILIIFLFENVDSKGVTNVKVKDKDTLASYLDVSSHFNLLSTFFVSNLTYLDLLSILFIKQQLDIYRDWADMIQSVQKQEPNEAESEDQTYKVNSNKRSVSKRWLFHNKSNWD